MRPPRLQGAADSYSCSYCKRKSRASKQLLLHTLPNVLVLHVKRFDALQGYRTGVGKICRSIAYPEVLLVAPSPDPKP